MSSYIEAQVLSSTLQKTRDLTRWYIGSMKDVDAEQVIEVNGVKLNSLYWMVAHLVWAENFLVLENTGGKKLELDWLNHYTLGSNGSLHDGRGDLKAVLDAMKEVHEASMQHILTITDEQMALPNVTGMGFGSDNSNRMMLQHCIRHEAMHTGHLSWLCKLNGVKMI